MSFPERIGVGNQSDPPEFQRGDRSAELLRDNDVVDRFVDPGDIDLTKKGWTIKVFVGKNSDKSIDDSICALDSLSIAEVSFDCDENCFLISPKSDASIKRFTYPQLELFFRSNIAVEITDPGCLLTPESQIREFSEEIEDKLKRNPASHLYQQGSVEGDSDIGDLEIVLPSMGTDAFDNLLKALGYKKWTDLLKRIRSAVTKCGNLDYVFNSNPENVTIRILKKDGVESKLKWKDADPFLFRVLENFTYTIGQ